MKKYFFYLVLAIIMIIPFNVNAASNIVIACDTSEINPGGEVSCTLSTAVEENVTYNKIELNVVADGSQSIDFISLDGFVGSIESGKLTVNSNKEVGNADIGVLKIKFNKDASSTKIIKINNAILYKDEVEVVSGLTNEVVINVKQEEAPATLDSLSVSDCDSCKLSPSFKNTVTFYMVNTKSDQIRINAEASNGSTVSGTGLKKLTKDTETFQIKVTSSTGATTTYKIKVTKEPAGDATLKSLSIDNGKLTPSFSSSVTSYTAVVNSDKVTITALANDSKATVSGTGEKKLEYGRNDFTIIVTASDGTTKNYVITINRPDNRNQNAYLKELTVNGEDIGFEKDIIDYVYVLKEDLRQLDIEAIPELENSQAEISGNENLKEGKNVISIKVTAEDGSEKTYKIMVIKEEGTSVESEILKELTITGYDIDFSSDKYEYTITIKNEKQLDITAVAEEGYTVEIVGNEQLQDGSIIKVIVTDEEDNSTIYKIKIRVDSGNNKSESNDTNYIPIIMISLLVILFIANIILIIRKVKK